MVARYLVLLFVISLAVLPAQSSKPNSVAKRAEYDEFFQIVDTLLFGQQDGRQYRRGYFGIRRPMMLSRRSGEPSQMYRSFVDNCYGLLCQLGINGLINRVGRMLM